MNICRRAWLAMASKCDATDLTHYEVCNERSKIVTVLKKRGGGKKKKRKEKERDQAIDTKPGDVSGIAFGRLAKDGKERQFLVARDKRRRPGAGAGGYQKN